MIYTTISLNGAWEMDYSVEKYLSVKVPEFQGSIINNAVPGYWEDMTEFFENTHFFNNLKINPEYRVQQYPMTTNAPDMLLPNVVGNFFYRRKFKVTDVKSPAVIHFSGVQNMVSVWINDKYVSSHEGYSTPFDISIPENVLKYGENTIVLSISNYRLKGVYDEPVVGLTSRAACECTGGITGDVELRIYSSSLRDVVVLISEDLKTVSCEVFATEEKEYEWIVKDGNDIIKMGKDRNKFTFDTSDMEMWSPENPKLYELTIFDGKYALTSNIGIRRLVADTVHLKLNGIPYYLRGVCEHCYFPETVHPNHDINYYCKMITTFKNLGFNFIRFHTYIPEEEYMQAADELGILLHIESPNNTTVEEWKQIVNFCRKHPSVVIYCCGNELYIDEKFAQYLRQCADIVHSNTDAIFSPLSALRGLEYHFPDPELKNEIVVEPFEHNPLRIKTVGEFSDVYSSYANGLLSYFSLDADWEKLDDWSTVYNKPRISHEICIDGTYTDLSLKERYKNSRIGRTDMFTSIERHLDEKGLLEKAPLYFNNSSQWQRRVRKYCFEAARMCNNIAGFDFLGPIDTHWHTFGYDVGMMNEFYELKPGETVKNVLRYNSPTVLLNDLKKKVNFSSEEQMNCNIFVSNYSNKSSENLELMVSLLIDGKVETERVIKVDNLENGKVSNLYNFTHKLPVVSKPKEMKLIASLNGLELLAENTWELYIFPQVVQPDAGNIIVSNSMTAEEIINSLDEGKDILLLGSEPFKCLPTSFRISLAGRTSGNLATVLYEHPILEDLPHEGFCGWQFCDLIEDGNAVCFENMNVPFDPIIEIVSSHKCAIRQAALFEFKALNGRVVVCSLNFTEKNPAADWLKSKLVEYMSSSKFSPKHSLSVEQMKNLIYGEITKIEKNENFAFNVNDKAAVRKNQI